MRAGRHPVAAASSTTPRDCSFLPASLLLKLEKGTLIVQLHEGKPSLLLSVNLYFKQTKRTIERKINKIDANFLYSLNLLF